jgi:hypothetical protein
VVKRRARCVIFLAACALWAPGLAMAAASPPTLTGSVANGGNLSGAIATAIAGHYAYTPGYYSGVVNAVDITDPNNPVVAGSSAWSSSLVNASTINVAGGYAYVVSKNRNGPSGTGSNDDGSGNSLTILDIATNPARPAIVGFVRDPVKLFGAYGVAVQGKYAYIAAQGCLSGQPCPTPNVGDSFVVIDISTPSAPTIVATLMNSSLPAPWAGTGALKHPTAVAIAGNYAFVTASYTNRLTILDISNPLAPQIVSSLQDASQLNFDVDVVVANGYAYVADQASGLGRVAVVDVHNPASPVIVGTVTNSTYLNGAYRIRAFGNFVYVAATYAGAVSAIDVSDPTAPRFAGGYQSSAVLNRAPGLDIDPTGRYVIAVSPFLSTDPQPIYPPYPFDPGGPTLTGTVAVVALDPVPITVTIAPSSEPPNPTTQTSANFTFSTSDAVASVRCRLDSAASGLCTSATTQAYPSLTPGSHTFTVAATDAAGIVASDSYTWTITSSAPSPGPGQTVLDDFNRPDGPAGANWAVVYGGFTSFLVSSNQAVDSSTSVYGWTYWQPQQFGPDSSAFVTVTSVSTDALRVCARFTTPAVATRSGYCVQDTANSWTIRRFDNGTAVILGSTFSQPVAAGDRIGIVAVGTTIEAWYAPGAGAWTRLSSQTDATYRNAGFLALESRGSRLDDFGGGTLGTTPVAPANTVAPTVTGTATQGQTLTANPGTWTGNPTPTYTYQWQRCDTAGANCVDIASATATTYQLAAADVGATVRVKVTATNTAGNSTTPSAATATVAAAAPGPQTSVLDNFNRANGPIGANWGQIFGGFVDFTVSNNEAADPSTSSFAWDYWSALRFGPDSEAYATITTIGTDAVRVCARMTNPTTTQRSGYCVQAAGSTWTIRRIDNGTGVQVGVSATQTVAAGARLGITVVGTTITAWYSPNASSGWTQLLVLTDTTYQGSGFIALEARASHVDDFGGGTR